MCMFVLYVAMKRRQKLPIPFTQFQAILVELNEEQRVQPIIWHYGWHSFDHRRSIEVKQLRWLIPGTCKLKGLKFTCR